MACMDDPYNELYDMYYDQIDHFSTDIQILKVNSNPAQARCTRYNIMW
jgi:hypothetical protein